MQIGEDKMLFIGYSKCSTAKKAGKWLVDNGIEFDERDIKLDNPKVDELKQWHKMSGLPLKKFFNTSGMKYKELGLKDKIPNMTEDEQFEILASDGMIVKRPLLIGEDFVLTWFKEKEWIEKLL